MPIYHCSVKPIQRSKGRSATAAAAYRAGERIHDERSGITHDYRRKSGVEHCEMIGWTKSRAELWNAAEQAEKRKDATTAREYEVALPNELGEQQRAELAREFGHYLHKRYNVAVDICIHNDPDNHNPHAHILTTTREVENGNALGNKSSREWNGKKRSEAGLPNRKQDLEIIREAWEQHVNRALERAGHDERIDHRSLKDQGIDREPTKHLGPKATAMERNGVRSDRGEENREIKARNDNVLKLAETQSEIRGLQEEKRKQAAYEKRFSIPDDWQAREQAILNNHRELFALHEKKQALNQQYRQHDAIASADLKRYDDYVREDDTLREYKDRIFQYEEQLSYGQQRVDDLAARGLWSQVKVGLAEKGYLTVGETAKAVEYRNTNAQALARSETLRDQREEQLYNSPLEKDRINQLMEKAAHRQRQAFFDGLSDKKKINALETHYQRVHAHTQTLIDLENKDATSYNREQIGQLKNLEKEIKNTEKTLQNTPELLPRKKDNTPLNDMEAAQHLPEFKAYNRDWHEKYGEKIREWQAFEKKKPELADRLIKGKTKTKYKLFEELKAATYERHDVLARCAHNPANAKAIEGIKRQYALEGSESHPKQRLDKLRETYDKTAEKPVRGNWRAIEDTQRMLRHKNNFHNAANKNLFNSDQRRSIKQERELETYRKRRSRYRSRDRGLSR